MSLVLNYGARSDVGLVRENNEDSAYAGPRLVALADGMGGHAAGEIASQYVVAALARLDDDQPGSDLTGPLTRAMTEGNRAIAEHVKAHPELDGMGCTLTALLFDGRRAGLIHVGDSRAYLLRDGQLTQITRDDTFVQSLVDEGKLSADEAHSHPRRSLILKALTGEPVEPTTVTREVREGDRYLLCSDGLSDPVSADTIRETLLTGTPTEAADRLVSLALRSGGPDNVTVVVVDAVEGRTGRVPSRPVVAGAASTDEPVTLPTENTAAGRAAAFSRARAAGSPDAAAETGGADGATGAAGSAGTSGAAGASAAVGAGGAAGVAGAAAAPRRMGSDGADGAGPVDDEGSSDGGDAPTPRRSRRRFAASVLAVLIVLGALAGGGVLLVRSNYFVGQDGNQVVVMRGVQGQLLGMELASVHEVGCLAADGALTLHSPDGIPQGCNVLTLGDLQAPARETVRGGLPSGSRDDADAQLTRLATDNLLPACPVPDAAARPGTTGTSATPAPPKAGSPSATTPATPNPPAPSPAEPTPGQPGTPAAPTTSLSPTPTHTGPPAVPGETCRVVN